MFFDGYKKYFLVRHSWDRGTDDGMDYDTKKEAIKGAKAEILDGWETVACINTEALRIEFVIGEPASVLDWFIPQTAAILKERTRLPSMCGLYGIKEA